MSLITINLNVDGTALTSFLKEMKVTVDEVLTSVNKLQTDVNTLIAADKQKIADKDAQIVDLTAKLAAATAANVDQAKLDLIGQTVQTIDATVTPTP